MNLEGEGEKYELSNIAKNDESKFSIRRTAVR